MESEINQSAIDNIMSRTSIRKFQDRTVENEKVTMILKAAMAAPSAVNKQPWQFVVVDDRNLLQQIASALPYAHMAATGHRGSVAQWNTYYKSNGKKEPYRK